jgi:hypothetical protein
MGFPAEGDLEPLTLNFRLTHYPAGGRTGRGLGGVPVSYSFAVAAEVLFCRTVSGSPGLKTTFNLPAFSEG